MPEVTLEKKGMMGTIDKSFMPFVMPSAGSKMYLIARIIPYQRFTSIIIVSKNNSKSAGVFIFNAGYGSNMIPGLQKIIGDKLAGNLFYKIINNRMELYYQCPEIDTGSIDIIYSIHNQANCVKYTSYSGDTENMTKIVPEE